MNGIAKGFSEVVVGILGGYIISTLLKSFQVEGLIPNSFFWAFTIIGFAGSLVLIYSFKAAGIMFTIGWVWGAWVLKDLLGTLDFFVYFIAPIAALVIRAILAVKKTMG